MSRDGDPKRAASDAELLTAYVDGVAEVPLEERHRVEVWLASDPGARADEAAVRALLGTLRELPPEGTEPDWTAMAQSIHAAVGHDVPRRWWRSWRWLVPLTTCAMAAVVLLVIWPRLASVRDPAPVAAPAMDAGAREPAPREDTVALWLDGAAVDVDLSAADLLGASDLDDDPPSDDVDGAEALLPASNLAWVDRLDDAALSRVERWLATSDSPARPTGPASPISPISPAGPASPISPAGPARKKG